MYAVAVAYDFKGTPYQLPGIRNDLGNFFKYCSMLGVPQDNIMTFTDIDPMPIRGYTKSYKTKRSFHPDFFKHIYSLPDNSKIVIYISSHGTQIKDLNHSEVDNLDEALIVRQGNNVAYIDDDAISNLLVRSLKPHQEVLALVDTCNSGTMLDLTATFSDGIAGNNTQLERTHVYNAVAKAIGISENVPAERATIVCIAAAKDFEYASATRHGSVFTNAVLSYLTDSAIFNNGSYNSVLQAQNNSVSSFIQLTEIIEKYKIRVGSSVTSMQNFRQNCVISCNNRVLTNLYLWSFVERPKVASHSQAVSRSQATTTSQNRANSECTIL